MLYCELREGDRVRLCNVVFTVTNVASSGAVLEAGRWNRLVALPTGHIGDMASIPVRGHPRLIGHTLADVTPASSS